MYPPILLSTRKFSPTTQFLRNLVQSYAHPELVAIEEYKKGLEAERADLEQEMYKIES